MLNFYDRIVLKNDYQNRKIFLMATNDTVYININDITYENIMYNVYNNILGPYRYPSIKT